MDASDVALKEGSRRSPSSDNSFVETVKLILVRHSESEENRRIESFKTCCRGQRGEMSCAEVMEIFLHRMRDAPISERGHRMIANVRRQMYSGAQQQRQRGGAGDLDGVDDGAAADTEHLLPWPTVDAYLHSPLERTHHTLSGLFPHHEDRFESLRCLVEKQPMEFVFPCTFLRRLEEFRSYLAEHEPWRRCVVVGGHSQFFKAFLGMDRKMENVEVIECDFNRRSREVTNARTLFAHTVA